jgi:hypothetical protein
MMEHNGQTCAVRPERVLRHSVSQLGSDVLTLMELQAELLQVDLKEWTSGIVKVMIALVAGVRNQRVFPRGRPLLGVDDAKH